MRIPERVQRRYRNHRLRNVEASLRLGQHLDPDEQPHQIAARHVVHDQVYIVLGLEAKVQLDEPWVVLRLALHHPLCPRALTSTSRSSPG